MNWFNRDIAIDPRELVVFGRDISLISDEDFRSWEPPSWITDLPTALENPQLVFSGIYEDGGWVSDASELNLRSQPGAKRLQIQGEIPRLGSDSFKTTATVSVDGTPVIVQKLGVGGFSLETSAPSVPGNHKIGITFSPAQHFQAPDGRIVGARIDQIGFPP
jgi:hypothetical protein